VKKNKSRRENAKEDKLLVVNTAPHGARYKYKLINSREIKEIGKGINQS
jgi:hypothetical protein